MVYWWFCSGLGWFGVAWVVLGGLVVVKGGLVVV